jgi:pyruvate formate lyase activating enzyme
MGADRLFFSGGEPTISLPYIERVVAEARSMEPGLKVNFDTNGFMTEASLERILGFADSFTYDIKAFFDDTHKALTGAPVAPVLRNAKTLIEKALDRIWEIRVTVVPGINDEDIEPLCEFLAGLSPDVPVNFLAFRPNFVLDSHPGASRGLLTLCVDTAMAAGLTNVVWTGMPGLPGTPCGPTAEMLSIYEHRGAAAAAACVAAVGCPTHPRQCLECKLNRECPVKRHEPRAANQPG